MVLDAHSDVEAADAQLRDSSRVASALESLADAALARAAALGARHASFYVVRHRKGRHRLRDGGLCGGGDTWGSGLGVRLSHNGVWGYAGTVELTVDAAARAAAQAVTVARSCQVLQGVGRSPAAEAVHRGVRWSSSCRIDPFSVHHAERVARLADLSEQLLASPSVDHVLAEFTAVSERRYYADSAGTSALQQRVYVHPMFTALASDHRGNPVSLRTSAPPSGRGWEYMCGQGWDWDAELSELPAQLTEKGRARPVTPGSYELVIDASNLWLTVHETVGHATELDRALGYEASYAGTTFVRPTDLGSLQFGSPLMNVTCDRTTPHGLATIGIDDEGVAAQSWALVKDGVLTGFQTDRGTAASAGASRSTGCAYTASALQPPLQRMPNVSLAAPPDGPDTQGLISGIEDGIYLVGAAGWSIDTRRQRFQFTAQRSHRIRAGRLVGQLSGVAYQGDTTDFWAALGALGGPATYGLFGADLCGKGQPVQIAATSHGCPAAVFRGVRVARVGADAT
jgi:TldD protein